MWNGLSSLKKKEWKRLEFYDAKRYSYERRLYFKSFSPERKCLSNSLISCRSRRVQKRKHGYLNGKKRHKIVHNKECDGILFIRYLYIDRNNLAVMQLEKREDRICPLSFFNCVSKDYIVIELKKKHENRFRYNIKSEILSAIYRKPYFALQCIILEYIL